MKPPTAYFPRKLFTCLLRWVVVFLTAIAWTCRRETPPEPYVPTIALEALDASCTEAWLRVRLASSVEQRAWRLARDGQTVLTVLSAPLDTLVVDEGLLPNRTYTYKAYRMADTRMIDSSTQVALTTMDTTSHNFTWQIDTLGDGGGSVLYDVAIINDTLAYAVGEIYKRDSVGNWDPIPYGLAIWNGTSWTLKKLFAQYPAVPSTSLVRPHGIFAFSGRDIWFADADVFWWDGQANLLRVHQVVNTVLAPGQYVDKIWGSSASDIYAVGASGAIAHYDGVRWRRIESGTRLPIQDIWGATNPRTGKQTILCVASNKFLNEGMKLLHIQGNSATEVPDSGLSWSLSSVWFIPDKRYYIAGDGIYPSRTLGRVWQRDTTFPAIYKDAVRGTGLNDIAVSGSNGLLSHFNGYSWKHYLYNEVPFFSGRYLAVALQGNVVVAVGYIGSRAIAVKGTR